MIRRYKPRLGSLRSFRIMSHDGRRTYMAATI
jgi:hypothetical protein